MEAVAKIVKQPANQFIKFLVVLADEKPVVVLVRGDHELNEAKLQRLLNVQRVVKANEATYTQISGLSGRIWPARWDPRRILL